MNISLPIHTLKKQIMGVFCGIMLLTATSESSEPSYHVEFTEPISIEVEDHRTPAIVYYAVDTEEPFMQLAVSTEIRQLMETCTPELQTNFVIIRNSSIVYHRRHLLVCRNGYLTEAQLPETLDITNIMSEAAVRKPTFISLLKQIRFWTLPQLSTDDQRRTLLITPLSYPNVLLAVLHHITTRLFPPEKYSIFLHIKAHGNAAYPVSGLLLSKKLQKDVLQEKVWLSLTGKAMPVFHPAHLSPALPNQFISSEDLSKINLGDSPSAPTSLEPSDKAPDPFFLGHDYLGDPRVSGRDMFGSNAAHIFKILRLLKQTAQNVAPNLPVISFLILESCDAHLLDQIQEKGLLNKFLLAAAYASRGALWYRNVKYNELIVKDLTTAKLTRGFITNLRGTPNYVYEAKP
jgi:hypothetical protein